MTGIGESLLALAIFGVWIFIARAVGIAAAKKHRRRWLWTILAVIPLGPVIAPLWLASMPVAGEKATLNQEAGRAVLILLIVGSQVVKLAGNVLPQQTADKASSEFGYETKSVTSHYKKMNVDEIVVCLQLNTELDVMVQAATFDEDGDSFLFETQREADIYNAAIALSNEMECDVRTYDFRDLDEAMRRIESGLVTPIRGSLV